MILWKQEKRANAQELINWLLSRRRKPGVWPQNDWSTTVAFAELGYSSSSTSNLNRFLIMQVLNKMSKNNKKTVEDFEATFLDIQKTNSLTINKSIGNWHFFIPIKVKLNPDINQHLKIRILGKDFSIMGLRSVKSKFDKKNKSIWEDPNIIRSNTGVEVETIPEMFLYVSGQAQNPYADWEKITPAFDTLRGIIELTLGIYRGHIMGGRQTARRKIPHPLWMVAYKKEIQPEWMTFQTEDDKTTRLFDLNNESFTRIKQNARTLKKVPDSKSTISLIADCLRLYSQAMDARFDYLCFLGFWQLAEAITRSESFGGKPEKVVSRIAWHSTKFKIKGSGYLHTLLALGNKRNDIVHRGINNIEDIDINILKATCEIALDWLFIIHKILPTMAHIEHYYSLREKSFTDFKAIRDSLVYIKKHDVAK